MSDECVCVIRGLISLMSYCLPEERMGSGEILNLNDEYNLEPRRGVVCDSAGTHPTNTFEYVGRERYVCGGLGSAFEGLFKSYFRGIC